MVASISPTSINSVAFLHSRPTLSKDTIAELKELGINISSISSEAQAKKIIEEKTNAIEQSKTNLETDVRLEKIYQRINTLAVKLDISVSSSEKIETVLYKIKTRISELEENKYNANINAIRSEYDSIKYSYEAIASANAALYTGLDILGDTKRAVMGLSYIKK